MNKTSKKIIYKGKSIVECRICNKSIYKDDNIKSICLGCFEITPANFDKEEYLKSDYTNKKIYKHICEEGHVYLSRGSNDKDCPTCKTEEVFCANCGKDLNFKVSKKNIIENNYFCKNNGKCSGEFNVKMNKDSGLCSICGKPNKERDQNDRGRDSMKGEEFIDYITNEKIFNLKGKLIADVGDICGCKCSENYYAELNKLDSVREAGRQNMINYNNSEEGKQHTKELNENKKKENIDYPGECKICLRYCEIGKRTITGVCKECNKILGQNSIKQWNESEEGKKFKKEFYEKKAEEYKKAGRCTNKDCNKLCKEG